jgi:hypothetical protein
MSTDRSAEAAVIVESEERVVTETRPQIPRTSSEAKARAVPSLAWAIIAVGLVLHVVLALGIPAYMAPDERQHFAYIQFPFAHHHLPVDSYVANPVASNLSDEFHQPPLFYLLGLPVYSIGRLFLNEDGVLHLVRFVSVGCWVVVVASTVSVLRRLQVSRLMAIVALGVVSVFPTWLYVSSAVGNDGTAVRKRALSNRDSSGAR